MQQTPLPEGITSPRGFRAAGGTCGIKASGKPDMTLIVADGPCAGGGVHHQPGLRHAGDSSIGGNLTSDAGIGRAIVVQLRQLQLRTGKDGEKDARPCAPGRQSWPATREGVAQVHRRHRPAAAHGARSFQGIAARSRNRLRRARGGPAAARGIMTTDLVPKSPAGTVRFAGQHSAA